VEEIEAEVEAASAVEEIEAVVTNFLLSGFALIGGRFTYKEPTAAF
jgi:methyl coenzyme M reductase subunit D